MIQKKLIDCAVSDSNRLHQFCSKNLSGNYHNSQLSCEMQSSKESAHQKNTCNQNLII